MSSKEDFVSKLQGAATDEEKKDLIRKINVCSNKTVIPSLHCELMERCTMTSDDLQEMLEKVKHENWREWTGERERVEKEMKKIFMDSDNPALRSAADWMFPPKTISEKIGRKIKRLSIGSMIGWSMIFVTIVCVIAEIVV